MENKWFKEIDMCGDNESIFAVHISTLNRGNYMNKSKFITRFKECYKEKGYTQEELAEKLNLSINGLKYYLRTKNDKLPLLIY